MKLPTFADPDNLIIPPDPPQPRLETPPSALALLQAIYKNSEVPLSTRMRAAALALPFESPRLTAVANISPEEFSDRLEKAIARSGGMTPRTVDALPRPIAKGGPDHSAVTDEG
jgi:hypothetical protein